MSAQEAVKVPRSRVRLAATWLVRLVLIAFLALVLAAVAVLIVVPRMTHGTALDVLTGSMTPDIPVGSIVIDRPVDPGTLHVGDIATYQKAPGVNEYITHRIIRINTKTTPTSFIFKGDANRGPDITPVPSGAIRGKVWFHVPYLGAIRDGLKGGMGRSLLLLLVTLGLAAFAVKQLVSARQDSKRGRDSETTAPAAELIMDFDRYVFGDVIPFFVGEVFHAESADHGDTFSLTFTGSEEQLAKVRARLAPYGSVALPVAEADVSDTDDRQSPAPAEEFGATDVDAIEADDPQNSAGDADAGGASALRVHDTGGDIGTEGDVAEALMEPLLPPLSLPPVARHAARTQYTIVVSRAKRTDLDLSDGVPIEHWVEVSDV